MTMSNLLLGLATGVPIMLAVGPISMLLVEAGLQRGFRRAWPAAIGVAAADLSFATGAAVAGVAAARALEPVAPWLSVVALVLLLGLAVRLGASARADLAGLRTSPTGGTVPAAVGGTGMPPGPVAIRGVRVDVADDPDDVTGTPVRPVVLAGGFFGITVVNPLTIVVFASIVLSGSSGVGTAGWVLGLTIASVVVHLGFVGAGHGIGTVLGPSAVARVRLGAAAMIALLGVWLSVG